MSPIMQSANYKNNTFTGPVPAFPESLLVYEAGDNQLEGSVSKLLPSSLTHLGLANNRLAGKPRRWGQRWPMSKLKPPQLLQPPMPVAHMPHVPQLLLLLLRAA
jgi:hypothetical protein